MNKGDASPWGRCMAQPPGDAIAPTSNPLLYLALQRNAGTLEPENLTRRDFAGQRYDVRHLARINKKQVRSDDNHAGTIARRDTIPLLG
jgi:hypothetical protein